MTVQTAAAPRRVSADPFRGPSLILVGGLCGLAWAAGIRGFMAQIVQEDSSVSWSGTFGYILLPGMMVGLLLGWVEHLRRTGRRGRWLALSPMLFAAVVFSEGPLGMLGIFEDGLGGGAIGVPLYAMAGGYAISGRGSRWGRLACGGLALTAIPIWAMTVESFAGASLGVTTPRGLWVALYYYSFLAVEQERPDLAIVDVRMPPDGTDDGARAAKELRARLPELAIRAALTARGDQALGRARHQRPVRLPAQGPRLRRRLHGLAAPGGRRRHCPGEPAGRPRGGGRATWPPPRGPVTPRERDVLALMAEGRNNLGIARRLWLTDRTVETHIASIMAKLGLHETREEHRRVLAVLTWLGVRQRS